MDRGLIPLIADYAPTRPLAWRDGRAVGQGEFLGTVLELARRLPNHSHAINLCHDRYHFMLGFCAALLNDVPSLLPPNRQPDTIRDIAAQYPGSLCLVDADLEGAVNTFDVTDCPIAEAEPGLPEVPANRLAAVAFTSGSTGSPVANAKYWYTLCGTAAMLSQRFAPGDEAPSIVATVPSQHMYGLEMTAMMALQGGCAIATRHPFYPDDVAATLRALPEPRLLVTTPVHLRHLTGSGLEMPPVRRIVSATAPLDNDLAANAEQVFGGSMEEIFGCTEAGSMATRRSTVEESWQLLDGMVMTEQAGAITVQGPQLAGPTPLQDRLDVLPGGRFRFLGRAADMVNVGGKRASLIELTNKLQAVEGVADAVVFMPGGASERPAALVVSIRAEREILRDLARRIDPVLLPRPLKKVAAIPRNETGKTTVALLQSALEGNHG